MGIYKINMQTAAGAKVVPGNVPAGRSITRVVIELVESPMTPRSAAQVGKRGAGAIRCLELVDGFTLPLQLGDKLDVWNNGASQRFQGTCKIHAIITADGVQGTCPDGKAIGVWFATGIRTEKPRQQQQQAPATVTTETVVRAELEAAKPAA